MPEIVLSSQQATIVAGAGSEVFVRDPSGLLVGRIVSYATPEQIDEAKRVIAAGGATHTTAQVWERIRLLEQG